MQFSNIILRKNVSVNQSFMSHWNCGNLVAIDFIFFPYYEQSTMTVSESDMTYSLLWWLIFGIRALHLPIQVHTHSSEHKPGAVGSHLCCSARVAVGGSVPCSRAPRRGIEDGEGAVHSLPPPTIPAGPRLELAIFRLWVWLSTIRPRH